MKRLALLLLVALALASGALAEPDLDLGGLPEEDATPEATLARAPAANQRNKGLTFGRCGHGADWSVRRADHPRATHWRRRRAAQRASGRERTSTVARHSHTNAPAPSPLLHTHTPGPRCATRSPSATGG